ncbi:MAG TPA: TetR/AcrR family transcriptional regulator [Desulfitobacterium dehalogenans]|uniref:TetR/AcrR family transcriptional regulator n=1 Tax=Desulfitobacterium dehalogenans TaxID=36854 RepID=A0A7C7DAL7_9FIRM|nr:TetR/AcrR family transcriptional regulator [Desulfitobacterium dehalogenans]
MDINLIHRKESLVIMAISLINEKGFQGLSTREVAKREGVSEATIFKHFKSKHELVLAVLEHSSQYDNALSESALKKDLTPKEKILHLIDSHMTYCENYPEITAIFLAYSGLLHDEELRDKVMDIISRRLKTIQSLIKSSIEIGELNPSVYSESLANIILGMIQQIILEWRMAGFSFSLREYTLTSATMLLDAFTTAHESKS